MHPWQHARTHPDRVAFAVADTGELLTYRELDEASNRGAHLFRELGLRAGDTMGLLLKNCAGFPIAYWAAQRAGLMIAPLSTHLQPAEAAHILNDCRAKVLVTAAEVGATAAILAAQRETLVPNVQHVLNVSPDVLPGAASWQKATAARPVTPIADETAGYFLLYSGGTTGRPKGVVQPFRRDGPIEAESATEQNARNRLGTHEPLVAFNGAPHAAPLVMLVAAQRMGATVVVLKKFDAIEALAAIEAWRATYAHFVPTMFVRMLRLPEDFGSATTSRH